ncbi:MAG: dihydrofolate reductase family protein [Burkholderiaceae bacterium]
MRRLRYNVAASLDGFIATTDGGFDWIVDDPAVDFDALFDEFDVFVMGRRSWEVLQAQGERDPTRGRQVVVASRSLEFRDIPGTRFVAEGIEEEVARLKREPGRDLWLFGGGVLARSLFDAGLVDTVEVAVMPVLLGSGVPLLPKGEKVPLSLVSSRALASGILMLTYRPAGADGPLDHAR